MRRAAMRGVLDDFEPVTPGHLPDARDVPHLSPVMDRQDRSDRLAGGQRRLDLPIGIRDIEVEIFDPAVSQDWARAEVTDDLRGCGEGHGRDDDPLTGLE